MNIGFQIAYRTVWGENVAICLTWATKTGKETQTCIEMFTTDGETWRGTCTIPATATSARYQYIIQKDGQAVRHEWTMIPRTLHLPKGKKRMQTFDRWRDRPEDSDFYTSAFTEAFLHHDRKPWPTSTEAERSLTLRVWAPTVPKGYALALLGNQPALGEWQRGHEVRFTAIAPAEWAATIDTTAINGLLEYKYLVIDLSTGTPVWEQHDNRQLALPCCEPHTILIHEDAPIHLPLAPWRGAGCVVPVFSLRSEQSFGVGDFGDLRRMVDWVAMTGQHALQILPINDTTLTGRWTDSYPYNSISIYALHPLYADLNALPPLNDASLRAKYSELQKALNSSTYLDYEEVMKHKRQYLQLAFQQEWETVRTGKPYKAFFADNEEWLVPYAAFCTLRDRYGTPDFRRWQSMSSYDADAIKQMNKRGTAFAHEVDFHCYVQFILHEQLTAVRGHAREKGVMLKGDIPIGISPTSVEAWTEPHYFNLDGQAGAPPDYFSQNGQNWGFPTYNWETMLADGCRWWRRRFEKMAHYFDAYRIDHVLGFFRIWEIPQHSVHGLLGQFAPSLPMSPDEIESFGLPWREHIYTLPYITDRIIHRLFGDDTAEVRRLYLEPQDNGHYALRPDFNTQRKVQAAFEGKEDAHSIALRDGLYRLISNVLFVRDRRQPNLFHPRIVAMHDFLYEDLNHSEREAFDRIHEHYFHHRHNQFWYEQAMQKLPILVGATRMLVCAEDLGMIPACVPWVMEQLGILTLEIQTMPKRGWGEFDDLQTNPYRSVSTITTHDMPTLRQWWDEQRETAQNYYHYMLGHDDQAQHPLSGAVAEEIVSRHLASPSMLCLLSLQDWLAIDEHVRNPHLEEERINVPANPRHYWRWRMHLTIEQLTEDTALNEKIRGLIKRYGR